jgi:FkbM family methyltransferase
VTDYSQHGEQQYILKTLGVTTVGNPSGWPTGRLLDIGAWNAKTFSNSRALIELGWSAVLFEPSPGPLRGLVEEYGNNPRVEVVGLAVGVFSSFIKIRCTDDALSADAANIEHLEKWKGYGFYGTMTTRTASVYEVRADWGDFDFVSIDTEGTSVDLFRRMVELGFKPRCVCIEHENRWSELKEAAEAGGYRLVHPPQENPINVVLELAK